MARGFAKKPKQTSSAHPSGPSGTQIPPPFTPAPSTLAPFLERLDPAQVHITHIDRMPPKHKKSIFFIPVGLNVIIAILLLWRFTIALPTYWALFQTLLGNKTPYSVDDKLTTRRQQFTILFWRFGMFVFDFFLFRFIGPWPLTFFLEQPANPCTWRLKLGFQKEELIVRVSRHWGAKELLQGNKQGKESPYYHTRILPAIAPTFMREKTGYLMMDKNWDLEFEVMQDAHELARRGELKLQSLDKLLLAYLEGVGWVSWRWETDDDVVEGRRKKVVAFKEELTKMGKESLFWKWTEIVEEERDRDGTFPKERQEKVAQRVANEFKKEGVDFDQVVKSIGGLDEVPPPTT